MRKLGSLGQPRSSMVEQNAAFGLRSARHPVGPDDETECRFGSAPTNNESRPATMAAVVVL